MEITNEQLRRLAEARKPPQSWYDEPEEELTFENEPKGSHAMTHEEAVELSEFVPPTTRKGK